MFYGEKAPHLKFLQPRSICGPARESETHNSQTTKLRTMCVSVCVPWGPRCVCWVRGGQGFNKGTGLVQGCQSDCPGGRTTWWGPDESHPTGPLSQTSVESVCQFSAPRSFDFNHFALIQPEKVPDKANGSLWLYLLLFYAKGPLSYSLLVLAMAIHDWIQIPF